MNFNKDYLIFILYRVAINIIALGLTAAMFKHVEITSFGVLIITGIALTLLNVSIKPLLVLISLPVVFLTMGIGYLIVNALILLLVSWFISGYHIDGFWTAFGVGIFVSIINVMFDTFASARASRFD